MELDARAGTLPRVNRRSVLRAGALGVTGFALSPVLAACTGTSKKEGSGGSKTATVGSNYSDATPKAAFAAVIAAWQQKSSNSAPVNTVAHNDFQNNINSYLQG